MTFTKIDSSDLVNKGVVGLPDVPNLSTLEMQQKFDELVTDVVVPKFNDLSDELDELETDKMPHSEDITDFKLDIDGKLQVSTDGGTTFTAAGSSGHTIVDGSGTSYPQRSKLQFSQNVVISDYDESHGNKTFLSISGAKGDKGDSATIRVGNVTSGNNAAVSNVGSSQDAIFDFTLPKGDDGDNASIQVGTVTSGTTASVSNRGTSTDAILDFVLPKGDKGDPGTGLVLLGMYATITALQTAHPTGQRGDAYLVGTSSSNTTYLWDSTSNSWKDVGALKGAKGDKGDTSTINVGTVTQGTTAKVENVGTTTDAVFDFTLPKGAKGDKGDAATISVGTVTSGATASVTNVGTQSAAILNFEIPKGDKGDKGDPQTINGKNGTSVTLYGADIEVSDTDDRKLSAIATLADTNASDIDDLETDIQNLQDEIENITATVWNATTTYSVGAYVFHSSALWKCKTQNLNSEPAENDDWTKVTTGSEITALNQSLAHINVYVGTDKKLHFVDKDGADSVLPFSSGLDVSSAPSFAYANWKYGSYSSIFVSQPYSGSNYNQNSTVSNSDFNVTLDVSTMVLTVKALKSGKYMIANENNKTFTEVSASANQVLYTRTRPSSVAFCFAFKVG